MYCKNCGAMVAEGAVFCTACGTKTGSAPATVREERKAEPAAQAKSSIVAIPIQLRTGLLKTQAAVLLIGRPYSALVVFDTKKYQSIVASGNKGGNYFQKVAGMMAAFGEYADALADQPLANSVAENPGSVLFEDSQINKLKIWNAWDAKQERYEDQYSFELWTTGGKYKGTLERSVNHAVLNARLRGAMGSRFN